MRSRIRWMMTALAITLQAAAGGATQSSNPLPTSAPSGPPKSVIAPGSYAGDQACAPCHGAKTATFARTAHRLTSQAPSRTSIAGAFSGPQATMRTRNPAVWFQMAAKNDGFFQTAFHRQAAKTITREERIDLVTGSGRKGQTFLFWQGDRLMQLPVSYWSDPGHWINSPGFPDGDINFDRQVQPRCLECHATFFEVIAPPNRYNTTNYLLGITCEKCHGPGRTHIAARSATSTSGARDGIVNTAKLSRDRQIELCAVCHGGPTVRERAPSFSYRPGEPFDAYFQIGRGAFGPVTATNEVHGNQVGLLKNSRCYQASQMTCSTCHDVHTTQRDIVSMSARCLTCHKVEACRLFPKLSRQIIGKCVDCHMPNQPSAAISISTSGAPIQPKVRNHWIKVYPAATIR